MLLKGKHHFLLDPFFRYYVIRKMNRSFHSVRIIGNLTDKNLPVLLICNHMSWWDGIWAFHVNRNLFKRRYFFMMLEEQLRKNWFLNYAGGYSVTKNSRSVLESINYTIELLTNKKNLVLLFPQGEIGSMHIRNFRFQKGIERILTGIPNEAQVVFLANFIDYHSNVRPNVYSFVEEYTGSYLLSALQKSYNEFYRTCLTEHINMKE